LEFAKLIIEDKRDKRVTVLKLDLIKEKRGGEKGGRFLNQPWFDGIKIKSSKTALRQVYLELY